MSFFFCYPWDLKILADNRQPEVIAIDYSLKAVPN